MAEPKIEPKATTGLETVTAPVVSEPTGTTPTPTGEALAPVGAPGPSVTAPAEPAAALATTAALATAAAPVAAAVDETPAATAAPPPALNSTPDSIPAITVKDVDSASQAGPQRVFSASDASPDAPTTSEPTPLALLWQVRAFQPS